MRTVDMSIAGRIKNGTLSFRQLKDEDKTPEVCKAALEANGNNLQYITNKTKEYCLMAVNSDGSALRYVPREMKSKEICVAAVRNNYFAIKHLPTADINILLAVAKEIKSPRALNDFSKLLPELDAETSEKLVKENKMMLAVIPNELKTKEMCVSVVARDIKEGGYSLAEAIPQDILVQDRALMTTVVAQDGRALGLIPEDKRDSELCRLAIESDSRAFKYFPDKEKTEDICTLVLKQDATMVEFTPKDMLTHEICEYISKLNPSAIDKYIPEEWKEEMYGISVEKNYESITEVPEKYITPEVYEHFLNGVASVGMQIRSEDMGEWYYDDIADYGFNQPIGRQMDLPEEPDKIAHMVEYLSLMADTVFTKGNFTRIPELEESLWTNVWDNIEDENIRLEVAGIYNDFAERINRLNEQVEQGELPLVEAPKYIREHAGSCSYFQPNDIAKKETVYVGNVIYAEEDAIPLENIPPCMRTYDLCKYAIRKGDNIADVPAACMDKDIAFLGACYVAHINECIKQWNPLANYLPTMAEYWDKIPEDIREDAQQMFDDYKSELGIEEIKEEQEI